jgi:hypothetical protein
MENLIVISRYYTKFNQAIFFVMEMNGSAGIKEIVRKTYNADRSEV